MEIHISFQRKRFNKATEEFLCSRLDEECDANLISNLKSLANGDVKKFKVNDANVLLIRLIQAIIINVDLEETINTTITDTEHESEDDDVDAELARLVKYTFHNPQRAAKETFEILINNDNEAFGQSLRQK